MKKGIAYLYKKCVASPIHFVDIEVQDDAGADDFKTKLIAAHKLLDNDFRIEIMIEDNDEDVGKRT